MSSSLVAYVVVGHVSPERFLDLIEQRGYTCSVEHVRYGYMARVMREEEILLPSPPGRAVTFTLRGRHIRRSEG